MKIRTATIHDLDAIAALEAACFPAAEAATKESFRARLEVFADHFWLLWDGEELVSMVDGMVTQASDLTDEMYHDASLHDPDGKWLMILGVDTHPNYRRQGCAAQVMERAIADAKEQGRLGLVLTCKEELLPFYSQFGFQNEGLSGSEHGNAVWYQVRLTL